MYRFQTQSNNAISIFYYQRQFQRKKNSLNHNQNNNQTHKSNNKIIKGWVGLMEELVTWVGSRRSWGGSGGFAKELDWQRMDSRRRGDYWSVCVCVSEWEREREREWWWWWWFCHGGEIRRIEREREREIVGVVPWEERHGGDSTSGVDMVVEMFSEKRERERERIIIF